MNREEPELKALHPDSKYVLPRFLEWENGEQARILRMFLMSIGLRPIRFHDLRATLATLLLSGCAELQTLYQPPQAWERDLLARDKMSIGGNAVEAGTDDHIFFSKEASSIGRTIGGGGCGCN